MHTTPRASFAKVRTFLRFQFLDHPRSLGEGYWEHQRQALHFAAHMITAGAACAVHALIPTLFSSVASDAVQHLYSRMSALGRLDVDESSRQPKHSSVSYS
jgi:hypothetical protein